jgi:ABC-2 type transport system permease protein
MSSKPDVAANPERLSLPDPGLLHLLVPKALTGRARLVTGEQGRGMRALMLGGIGALFWMFIFATLYRLLMFFRNTPEIGGLLAGKLLGLVLVGFLSLLLLSNVITALSSFFLAKDLDILVGSPTDWLRLYGAKLLETLVNSSWMVVLMALPMFAAYGVVYEGGALFAVYAVALFLPFLIVPSVLGSAITLVLVNVFPARRTRDILSVIAVLTAGMIVLMFRLVQPERLARPEGFRSLVDFVGVLRTPSSPFLPSEWLQKAVMGWLEVARTDWLGLALLWTTAGAFVVGGALLHRWLYYRGYSKAQESAQMRAEEGVLGRLAVRMLAPFGSVRRELVLKELRLFFRDTTQWSQLILLGVLIVVYVFNIRLLPLTGEGITFLLRNIVPFLNLGLAGFVLASIAARFLFPGVSLEGRTLWLLRSSPILMRDLLWAKFWVGTLPLLILALIIVAVTNVLLQVTPFMFAVSIATITMMTFALSGLAIGFGTFFPQYETENAAQIPTSFGGLLYMMSSIALIGGIIVLEARPVYSYLLAQTQRGPDSLGEMVFYFGVAALACVVATVLPLRLAQRRLEYADR